MDESQREPGNKDGSHIVKEMSYSLEAVIGCLKLPKNHLRWIFNQASEAEEAPPPATALPGQSSSAHLAWPGNGKGHRALVMAMLVDEAMTFKYFLTRRTWENHLLCTKESTKSTIVVIWNQLKDTILQSPTSHLVHPWLLVLLVLLKHLPMPWPKTSETAMVSESSAKSRVCGSIHVGSCGYGSRVQDTSRPYNLVDTHDSHDEYLYTYRYISIHIDIHIYTYCILRFYVFYCFSLFHRTHLQLKTWLSANLGLKHRTSVPPGARLAKLVGADCIGIWQAGLSVGLKQTRLDPWPISVSWSFQGKLISWYQMRSVYISCMFPTTLTVISCWFLLLHLSLELGEVDQFTCCVILPAWSLSKTWKNGTA